LIGSIAAAEIAQAYHPDPRTQYTLIGRSLLFRFASLTGLNLFEELFLKKLTTHAPEDRPAANVPVLREGSPVILIAVDGFGTRRATAGQTVTFVLAQDLTQSGKVLAHAGDIASGLVTQVSPGPGDTSGGVENVALQHVMLRAGKVVGGAERWGHSGAPPFVNLSPPPFSLFDHLGTVLAVKGSLRRAE
jgi:hypothetical protein